MNNKKLNYSNSSKGKKKDMKKIQNNQDKTMVSVGMKKAMKAGYWSKKPGQKFIFIYSPARQPYRKGPVRSKTTKGYNSKPILRCSKT